MSIRKRLASFVMSMVGLLLFIGVLFIIGGPIIVGGFRQSLDAMSTLSSVRELRSNVSRQRTALNGYLLVGDTQELMAFQDAARQASQSLDALKAQFGADIPTWVPELIDLFNASNVAAKEVTALYKSGRKDLAYEEVSTKLFPRFQKFFDRVNTLEQEKTLEAQTVYERVRLITRHVATIVAGALIVAFIMGWVLFRSLYKSVMQPLEYLRRGAEEFGKGHWDHRIDLPANNEFGALAKSFNTMADNVKQLQLQAVHMDRMSAVGQLAGGVAHEINNPLTAVLGQAQILMAKIPETNPAHAQIKKIEQAALRCKKIVRGLLDFSRPSQSTFESIDMNNVIISTLDLCEADLKKAKVVIEKHFSPSTPKIKGNASELQQVLLNLINNAIQAMPGGGSITIETGLHRGGTVKKVLVPAIDIRVKDTGIGIAKEHLSRVFEPFFTTKEIGQGTGLGLAVSMGIMQKHSGDLRVESLGANRGATFTMVLPVSAEKRVEKAA